jgi:glutamyl-tRNA synthetase
MSPAELAAELEEACKKSGIDTGPGGRAILEQVAPLLAERMKRLTEAPSMIRFLFEDVEPDDKAKKALAGTGDYLAEVARALSELATWTAAEIEASLRAVAQKRELKPKQAFQPIRAAVTGTLISPPLFESLEILGRDATLKRLEIAAAGA